MAEYFKVEPFDLQFNMPKMVFEKDDNSSRPETILFNTLDAMHKQYQLIIEERIPSLKAKKKLLTFSNANNSLKLYFNLNYSKE